MRKCSRQSQDRPAHLDDCLTSRPNTSFSNSWICTPTRCCVVVPFGCWRSNVATSSHVGLRPNLSRNLELHGVHPSRSPNLRCANDFVPPNLNIRQAKRIYLRSGSGSASGLGPRQRQMRDSGVYPWGRCRQLLRLASSGSGLGLKAQGSGLRAQAHAQVQAQDQPHAQAQPQMEESNGIN